MKLFLFKILLFLLPTLFIGLILEFALRNIPNDFKVKERIFKEVSKDIEVLFLGNSHAYRGINPKFMDRKSFNAAYVSQSLDIDYKFLEHNIDLMPNLSFVVIPISYATLFGNLESSAESWRLKNYCIYYNINLSSNVIHHSELLSIDLMKNLKRLKKYYYEGLTSITTDSLGYGIYKGVFELEKTGEKAAKRHTKDNYDALEDNIRVLQAIIKLAREKQLKIIFYTPPAYYTYRNNLDSNQLNLTFSILNRINNKIQNVYYINFLDDKEFNHYDYFDADHLNQNGAEKLTKKIATFIQSEAPEN